MFAGCGGLSIGLEMAGIKTVAAVESWKPAADSFKLNHPGADVYNIDARDFLLGIHAKNSGFPKVGDFDIISGGPPCQGFCGINRHRNISDPRNSLVEIFLDCVSALKPKAVIMENVNGILSLNNGMAIVEALQFLNELGYTSDFRVVQAGSFGVPQNRWRVILFAVKGEVEIFFPQQLHAFHRTVVFDVSKYKEKVLYPISSSEDMFIKLLPELRVQDAIGDLPELSNGECYTGGYTLQPTGTYARLLRRNEILLADHQSMNLGPINLERVSCLKPDSGDGWISLPDNLKPKNLVRFGGERFGNRFARLYWERGFSTILTKPEPYWGRVIHPRQNRLISARESARAQGFPDAAKFSGTLTERYKMIGNAVPPPLARSIGWALRRTLGDFETDKEIQEYGLSFQA